MRKDVQQVQNQISQKAAAQEQLQKQVAQLAEREASMMKVLMDLQKGQRELSARDNALRSAAQDQAVRASEQAARRAGAQEGMVRVQQESDRLCSDLSQVQAQRAAKEQELRKLEQDVRDAEAQRAALEQLQAQLTQEIGERPQGLPHDKHNIAIVGVTGAGKSTLVNRLRGLKTHDPGAAAEGVTDTTQSPTPYMGLGDFDGALLWDMPGADTERQPWSEYIQRTGLRHFNAIVLVANFGKRLDEKTAVCYNALTEQRQIPVYLLLNKVDLPIMSLVQRGRDPAVVWQHLRQSGLKQVRQGVDSINEENVFLCFNVPIENQDATALRNAEYIRFVQKLEGDFRAAARGRPSA